MQLSFGTGALWGERVDTTGTLIGPQQFAVLQDTTVTFDFTSKPLIGQKQFPVAVARGVIKVTGSAKSARILGRLFSDIAFGESITTGQFAIQQDESQPIAATVSVTNAATYLEDLGVRYASGANAGKIFDRVTAGPAAGQYSYNIATGVYSFAAADVTVPATNAFISYRYTNTTSGRLITLNNHNQGYTPYWKATFYQSISPNPPPSTAGVIPFAFRLNACTSTKLVLATKIDDWEIPNFDFEAFADGSDVLGYMSSVE